MKDDKEWHGFSTRGEFIHGLKTRATFCAAPRCLWLSTDE